MKIQIGKEEPTQVQAKPVESTDKPATKAAGLGGLIEFSTGRLSDEQSVSSKLLKANKEWVYKNNDVIAKEVSKIEFILYRVGLKGGEITYTPLDEHPLLDILDKFNGETTRVDALYLTQSHRKLTGDAFWLLDRNGKSIDNMFILPPDKVQLKLAAPSGPGTRMVTGYEYTDEVDGKRIEKVYKPEDIIHFRVPNPNNPFRGYGFVEAAADTIDVDNLANYTQRQFFDRGAITNFVLTTDKNLGDEQVRRLEAKMRSKNGRGARTAFLMMLLTNGLKPTNISFSNKDMQFLDQLEWYRDKLMVLAGNTKASLGIVDDVNRASHESSMTEWKRVTVKPEMDAIVATLNEFFVPLFGDKLLLAYVDPVPDDRSAKVDEATKLKQAAIITTNEARELLDYEPAKDGDSLGTSDQGNDSGSAADNQDNGNKKSLRTPSQVRSLGDVPREIAHMDIRGLLRRRKMFTEKRVNHELKETVKPIVRKFIEAKKATKRNLGIPAGLPVSKQDENRLHAQFTNEVILGYRDKQIHIVDVLETQFQHAVERLIDSALTTALQNLEVEISTRKSLRKVRVKELVPEEDFVARAQLDLTPLLMNEVILAGQQAYDLIGVEDVYIPYKLREAVTENVDKFARSMLDTDRQVLADIISNGIEQGSSVPEIRTNIQDKFAEYSKMQAERVTRTEVLRASNMAAEDAFKQSGIVEAKQWLVASSADEKCQPYAGKIVVLGGNFYDPGNQFQDGNPPIHPNCRCVLVPIVSR